MYLRKMYILTFKKNSSKYFRTALKFAMELNGSYQNGIVRIEIENVLTAYAQIRTLFSIIQKWSGTSATYLGKEVHPYQFLLHAHWIGDCHDERLIDNHCGNEWGCMKIDNLRYHIPDRPYKSHRYWYRYGYFSGQKWIIDKDKIYQVLYKYAEEKAITLCPFFDEIKLRAAVDNLPDYVIPDGSTFGVTYLEQYAGGSTMQVPNNVCHLKALG